MKTCNINIIFMQNQHDRVCVNVAIKINDELTYHFRKPSSMFRIHKDSGLITLSQSIQPVLTTFPATLQVFVKESKTGEQYESPTHDIVVNIIDENIHNPVFTKNSYAYSIPLTTKSGTRIDIITATDKDKGINNKLTYNIIANNVPFKIESKTGELTVSDTLEIKSYNFVVIGQDGTISPRSSVVMVTVNITSSNQKPTFSKFTPKKIDVVETTTPGTILTTILATDPNDDKLTFQVKSSGDYFEIEPSPDKVNQVLKLAKWLNESSLNTININITVTDGIEIVSTSITITIIHVNSYVPVFAKPSYMFSIKENIQQNTIVDKVKAIDKDGDTVEYSLPDDKYFQIDGASGTITTRQTFNESSKYCFVVQAFDSDKQYYGVAQVVVDVQDINNNRPKFESSFVKITVLEDNMCHNPIYTPKTTDDDISPENQDTVYSTNHSDFLINKGSLYMKNSSCKIETFLEKSIDVTITASNRNKNSLTDTMKLEIYFKDINNHFPEFEPLPSVNHLYVNESTPVGSSLYKFTVKDKDITYINGLTKFSIEDQKPNMDKIRIDPLTGILYLNKPLDYDHPNYDRNISFKVLAENLAPIEGGTTLIPRSVEFTVITLNEDDILLQFENTTYVVNVDEHQPQGTVVLKVFAMTGAKYSIDNKQLPFILDSNTGELSLKTTLDYNTKSSYVFPIEASHNNEKSSAIVGIIVNNVNDTPTIHEPLDFTVSENLPTGSIIGHIFATDPDNDNLVYQLSDENFFLNSTTGNLYTKKKFDYESRKNLPKQFTLNVKVTDNSLSDTKQITVTLSNTKDTAPQFSKAQFSVTLAEKNFNANQLVTSVPATNVDNLGSLTYKIYGDSRFEIQNNGQVIINSSYQVKPVKEKYISLMVVANNGLYESSALLVVEVLKSLEFVKSDFNLFVKQNTSTGTDIFQLSPYLLVDSYVDMSKIKVTVSDNIVKYDSTCSCIVINGVLDKQKYNVTLSFSQNSDSSSTQLIIHVLPVNSHPPQIKFQNDVVNIPDDAPVGYVVSNVKASDADFNSGFTFYLTETYNKFQINSANGILTVTNSLDSLLEPSYNLIVFVQDHGSPPRQSQKSLQVNVINSNKFPPEFKNLSTNFKIEENSNSNNIFKAIADDRDFNSVTFAITKGNLDEAFEIDKITGVLSVKDSKVLDFETVKKFELTITVTDNAKNPRSTSKNVTINLIDVNDNSPKFQSPSYFAINLPIEPNREVFQVNAVDFDSSRNNYNVVTYTVLNFRDLFNIDAATGKVTSKKNLTNPMTYFIVIQACDGGHLCTNHTVHLLTSSNTPIFVNVKENVSNAFVLNLNVSRRVNVTYYLKTCSDFFTVDSKTGILRTKLPLRWSPIQTSHTVIVVEDTPKNSSEVTVIVIIEDINDHDPEFQQSVYEFNVLENSRESFRIKATDSDSLLNANITYYLKPISLQQGSITIDAFTGLLTVSDLDMEKRSSHRLEVVANDNGNPPRKSIATVSITVEDQNDNKPVFVTSNQIFSVTENSSPNQFITNVIATDADPGYNGQVFYKLLNSSLPFTIDPITGALYTTHSLDYETSIMYNVEIIAYNLGEPQLNNTYNITIQVIDVCDNKIQLRPMIYIPNDFIVDHTILSFAGSTSGTSFMLPNDQGIFSVDNSSGELSISSSFPGQTNSYNVTMVIQNQCNITVEKEVTIQLYDVPKRNSGNIIEIELAEETVSNGSLFNFSSLVEFQRANVVFELKTHKDYFRIEDNQLMHQKPVDREIESLIKLFVDVLKPTRVKRSVSNTNIIKTLEIDVMVTDTNDNGPQFSEDTLYFGIPISASQFFEIGKIQAEDKDAGENSISIYSLTGEHKDKFFINPLTANLHNLFVPAAVTQKEYTVTVVAVDKMDPTKNDTVNVEMSIYSTEFSMILTVNATANKVRESSKELIRNMSNLLELQIVVDHIQVHIDDTKQPDVNRTDILFHAIDKDTMKVISKEELEQKLKEKDKELSSLLKKLKLNKETLKEVPVVPPNRRGFDKSLIIIIVLAIIVLIIAISTIILFVLISRRYKKKFDELQSLLFKQPQDNPGYEKNEAGIDNFERNSNNSSGHVSGSSFDTDTSFYNSVPVNTDRNEGTSFSNSLVLLEGQPISSETQITPLENQETQDDNTPHLLLDFDVPKESDTDDIPTLQQEQQEFEDGDVLDCSDLINGYKTVTFKTDDVEESIKEKVEDGNNDNSDIEYESSDL